MNGVINVYKEPGYTSFDVVAKLRGILKTKKIGHTGTLDPDAEGVLPVCIGKATKLCDYLTVKKKIYEAVLELGVETDTLDRSGTVLRENIVSVDESAVRAVISSFIGKQKQIPPMYSALKVNGQKLCDLARKGIEVERRPREIEIYDIKIKSSTIPFIKIEVECSKGTYIRTLCNDIGSRLQCGGCMKQLTRVASGAFSIDSALKLSEIEQIMNSNNSESAFQDILIPVDHILSDYPVVRGSIAVTQLLENGNKVPINELTSEIELIEYSGSVRMYDANDRFVGIFKKTENSGEYRPEKMFR
ncbi:MAG: tRNA pseudouridine(55) synthase TruB [Lachnospiraceae bacterium]